jgi:uncharacterized protein YndB with AHSA1/START domain
MPTREYRFATRWRVYGTPEEVFEILSDPSQLPNWWPSVYLAVEQIDPPSADGSGRRVALLTRGWLPYQLGWILRVVESRRPDSITVAAEGDLEGRGVWTIEPDGAWVTVTFEWEVDANKPLLKAFAPLFAPAFQANHRWAMARGGESLAIELARRRATAAERAAIPPPPPSAGHTGLLLAAGAAGILGLAVGAVWLFRPRRRGLLRG